ncbi:tRNA (guanosine(46)-N7)-methyltransferase TrmB [candidate division KSB3 bacterium]|uniref:tRNA (guanine-N(7)-)-methyltransferase n=1 Tax=candidate division KSB3 bacterium TaxID=2044937 RepID=A0A2G6E8Z5_9BACT|nr:MAG: tRNA (guanosine(46)-N7)-methyltransferase TrmB [candidate division KSB3 bacterium]PIE30545.1 MAG: tRNA (guanosine(46)-N7)-methyltransferase TrmB [candidate division KSB3 bacterium]
MKNDLDIDPDIEIQYQNMEARFSWEQIFGNTEPVEIEIGFGKCAFLIAIARDRPTVNFVGIEVSRKYYRKGLNKIQRAEMPNVKLLYGEAFYIFKRFVPDESITNLYINCPDPWPKKRHAKRRLFSPSFIEEAARTLIPCGCIDIATDVAFYMKDTLEVFQACEAYQKVYALTHDELNGQRRYFSEYEQQFLQSGKTMYYARFKKVMSV